MKWLPFAAWFWLLISKHEDVPILLRNTKLRKHNLMLEMPLRESAINHTKF
jgi:hypothetical protein